MDDLECKICFGSDDHVIALPCGHPFHDNSCLGRHIETKINDRIVDIKCPECKESIPEFIIQHSIAQFNRPDLLRKFFDFSVKIALDTQEYFDCPNKKRCKSDQIPIEPGDTYTICQNCQKMYCIKCKEEMHFDLTCEQY